MCSFMGHTIYLREDARKYLFRAGGVRSIFLLPIVSRCIETIDVCIWCMFVFKSVVEILWGSVGMFVV